MKFQTKEEVDELLVQLREGAANVIATNKKYDNDFYLYRWLIHNKMKADQTAKLINESLDWRQEMDMDTLANGEWAFWDSGPKMPAELHFGGISKRGQPVATVMAEDLNFREILQEHNGRSLFRYIVQYVAKLEKYMMDHYKDGQAVLKYQSSDIDIIDSDGPKHLQTGYYTRWNSAGPFIIVNCKNFSLWNVTCIEAVQIIAEVATTCMKSFPACACEVHFVNMNQFSRTVLSILKRVLNTEIYCIEFHGMDKAKWRKAMLEKIDADQLDSYFGGTKDIDRK